MVQIRNRNWNSNNRNFSKVGTGTVKNSYCFTTLQKVCHSIYGICLYPALCIYCLFISLTENPRTWESQQQLR
jgi:hypothetical protein